MQIAHVSVADRPVDHPKTQLSPCAMHYAWPFVLTRSCTNPIPMAVAQDM